MSISTLEKPSEDKIKQPDAPAKIEIEDYSDSSFWSKCLKFAKTIGYESMNKIFQLYYALESNECTLKHKSIIYGALAYLVSPIDAIPDLTPFIGYTDDMGVIVAALAAVAICINDEVKMKAEAKLKNIFGEL